MTGRTLSASSRTCSWFALALPSLITLLGHVLSLWWLLGGPVCAGVIGLLCDAADGAAARGLRACSQWGSLYDWTVDVTMAALLCQRLHLLPLLILLVPLQVWLRRRDQHLSGRTWLMLTALVQDAMLR